MTQLRNDPRDIERIHPDMQDRDTNTNNISVLGESDTPSPVKGAVVKSDGEATTKKRSASKSTKRTSTTRRTRVA